MKKIINTDMNKYIISFLIYTITLFGILSFFINKNLVDSWINYYIIIVSGIAGVLLFIINLNDFKWKNIRKVPFFLTILTIIWIVITSFMGIRFKIETIKGIINFSCLLGIGFIIMNISLTKEDIAFIFKSCFIAAFVCILVGIFQYFSGINLIKYSNSVYPGILGRINSTFLIATILDKYLVLITVLIIYCLYKSSKWYLQILLMLVGVGISLTFSRSGQLTFLFLIFLFFVIAIWKKQLTNVLAIIITVLIMYLIPGTALSIQSGLDFVYYKLNLPTILRVDITFIDDFYNSLNVNEDTSDNTDSSSEKENWDDEEEVQEPVKDDIVEDKPSEGLDDSIISREFYASVGLQLIHDYPIFGIGVGNYSYLYNTQNFDKYISDKSMLEDIGFVRYPHNGIIHAASEIGYIGLTLLILTLFSYVFYADFKRDKFKLFSIFLLFASLALASYTESVFNTKQYIFLFIIFLSILCCKNIKLIENNRKK